MSVHFGDLWAHEWVTIIIYSEFYSLGKKKIPQHPVLVCIKLAIDLLLCFNDKNIDP